MAGSALGQSSHTHIQPIFGRSFHAVFVALSCDQCPPCYQADRHSPALETRAFTTPAFPHSFPDAPDDADSTLRIEGEREYLQGTAIWRTCT